MQVKILSKEQVASLGLTMREIMDGMIEGWKIMATEKVELPAKIGVHPRKDCYIHAMPCFVEKLDSAIIKWAAGYPSNFAKKLPYINGIIVVNNPDTGLVEIIMDSAWVTAWRTGGATGVCAQFMAADGAGVASVVGTGVQGIATGLALKEGLPALKTLKIYDVVESQMDRFISEVKPACPNVEIVKCASPKDAVEDCDVIATAVPILEKPQPIIRKAWLKPDALAITEDYDSAYDADIMMSSTFVCDDRNQYLQTQSWGTYFQSYPREKDLYADMSEICCGTKAPVKKGLRGAVLMGIAMHDVMTVRLIQEKLKTNNIGQDVEI